MGGKKYNSEMDYFLEHVKVEAGCWLWTAGQTGTGCAYGLFYFRKSKEVAHRAAYRLFCGTIPAKHDVHHVCKVKLCVNPKHLMAVTRSEHLRLEPTNHLGTHCIRGHERTAANTYTNPQGRKSCRRCQKEVYDVRRGRKP